MDGSHKMIVALSTLFAIALQFQVTLFASADYLGLRINAADALLPLAILAATISIWTGRSRFPDFRVAKAGIWFLALTAILFAALIHGYFIHGEISRWAVTNKLCGWLVMIGLFYTGGWIGANSDEPALRRFLGLFCVTFLIVLLYQLAYRSLQVFDLDLYVPNWMPLVQYQYLPIAGSMANRNAYALLFVTVVMIAGQLFLRRQTTLPAVIAPALFFLLPAFTVFNGSRAMGIALVITMASLFIVNRADWRRCLMLLACLGAGTLSTTILLWERPQEVIVLRADPVDFVAKTASAREASDLVYPGDSIRLTVLRDAIEQIEERPWLGSGLGGAMIHQARKHGQAVNVIDSTPLWLLTETGILGLLAFALFYFKIARALISGAKKMNGLQGSLHAAICLALLGFTISCLLHEILFTRHLWFLLGLCLAIPTQRPAGSARETFPDR